MSLECPCPADLEVAEHHHGEDGLARTCSFPGLVEGVKCVRLLESEGSPSETC